jgi:hypothetical protein
MKHKHPITYLALSVLVRKGVRMNARSGERLLLSLFFVWMIATAAEIRADGHRKLGQFDTFGYEEQRGGRNGHGDGAFGTLAAWLLGIANFTVAVSIVLKTSAKMISPGNDLRKRIERFNIRQKKYFMQLHYWLNPLAIVVAIFHFAGSKCASTLFPELGLAGMLLIFILGLMITLKLAPAPMRRLAFQFHTSPVFLIAILSILLIGHSMID